ncbi:MAG TPA: hypothetical protein VGL22_16580 [Terracidiphilus sp.]|jgi:hypothetical protein
MSASAQAQPSPKDRSFAGLLAELAAPEKKFPPARDLDGLADDIATLSYESALKTHARYRPTFPPAAELPRIVEVLPQTSPPAINTAALPAGNPSAPAQSVAPRKLASITVRLTRAEDEQLRHRAAEAGLTLSAYLRSCAFEVESLRAQVKQTIAELRQAEAAPPLKRPLTRLFAWRRRSDGAAGL